MSRTFVIIPARYDSERFPGKPLVDILGKPMVQHVYERAVEAMGSSGPVWVSTDDPRIQSAVQAFGGNVVITSPAHENGTTRCAWTALRLGAQSDDVVINVQGDQPLVEPHHIAQLDRAMHHAINPLSVTTLVTEASSDEPPGTVYAVLDNWQNAMYFSRSRMPFPHSDVVMGADGWKHVGLYAYRVSALSEYIKRRPGRAELTEGLEQLRWLEWGDNVRCIPAYPSAVGPEVNYPSDVERVIRALTN